MNEELIRLQRGCNATCVIIPDHHYQKLRPSVIMESRIGDEYLFASSRENPIFKSRLEQINNGQEIVYFVIRNIDQLTIKSQNRFLGLIKDREFNGYHLPENVIIVLTVKDKETLKNVAKDLYHFSVVAF